MKLNEITTEISQFYTDPADIYKWISNNCDIYSKSTIDIKSDGTVDMTRSIDFNEFTKFKVRFGTVHGDVQLKNDSALTSMEGCPQVILGYFNACGCLNADMPKYEHGPLKVTGEYDISYNAAIKSFDGIPRELHYLVINDTGITSLIGVENHFNTLNAIRVSSGQIKEGGIGLLLINNFIEIEMFDYKKHDLWVTIINSYAGRPDDIFECQAELIEAGYEEYARL